MIQHEPALEKHHGFTSGVVRAFLESNLSIVLILLAAAVGVAALMITPREEDPQIVVPLADVLVDFPGHAPEEVERLVATPLEKLLYQIDGVEYVYSMARENQAVITVRYYVGEDRERSLVKLYKRIDENIDIVPPGVTGWVVKPVEIDDVPIVTLTLTSATADDFTLRRVAEELVERLASVPDVSRAYVVGGQPRTVYAYLDPERLRAYRVAPLDVQRALIAANVNRSAGDFTRDDAVVRLDVGGAFTRPDELKELVVGLSGDRPVFLKDVADIQDGPAEAVSYVRHGWGPARGFEERADFPGALLGAAEVSGATGGSSASARAGKLPVAPWAGIGSPPPELSTSTSPAVTIAIAKKKGTNAVTVARQVLAAADGLKREVVPDNIDLIVTRNAGLTSDDKVNELIEALGVAVFIVVALLTIGLGWREALIVAVAVPVVFGLTLAVNLLFGYTINRVTLFALILALGLLVDDPIVDVENISRHFHMLGRATRAIVIDAVAEIRPPLITATLAVIVSFLPMFFITGMMGPYMRPMALNVPVTMVMSMVVAFTITPWLAFHVLKRRYGGEGKRQEARGKREEDEKTTARPDSALSERSGDPGAPGSTQHSALPKDPHDIGDVKQTLLYRMFYPLMAPLLHSRKAAWTALIVMGAATAAAALLAATRHVPLKMLPFDNKNELLLVLDFDEGTTLERADAAVREFEASVRGIPELVDFSSYVGVASPMDFNGLVRHYYLRRGPNVAELRLNFVHKKSRREQSHALGLRLRDELTALAAQHGATLSIVETPPGPPVIASVVAEVYGRPEQTYADLVAAAKTVRTRMEAEPGVVDVDDTVEADTRKLVFVTDREKAALSGITVAEIADTVALAVGGAAAGTVRVATERNPLQIDVRLPRALRSSAADLSQVYVKGAGGTLVPLAELGHWREVPADKTIYHKNLERVVYVFAETAGRPPADCVVDIQADRLARAQAGAAGAPAEAGASGRGWVQNTPAKPVAGRTFFKNGSGIAWALPEGIRVDFAGEGEWKITLDVFRDLGLAFAAALVAIYVLLVGQTGSFVIPVVVMLAIPLTVLGIMPGFWLLNAIAGGQAGGYADPIFFTATGMIGMIALAGIVTRDSIILVDFIHLSLRRGRSLFEAIMESRVVRLRPILLTAATAMLSAAPITIDPIFSGLAWALIFGLFASTVFTLFVIPISYWLLYANKPGHGLPATMP